MASSLATHLSASLFLLPTGLRRLLHSTSLYLKDPSIYKSKPWHFSDPKYKNVDFYFLLASLPLASFTEFLLFLSLSSHPSYKFSFFLQSQSLFFFWALLLLLFLKTIDRFVVHDGAVFVIASVAFFIDFYVSGKGVNGVALEMYRFSGWLSVVCAFCCGYLAYKASGFFAEFVLCSGMIVKGSWMLQCGLVLYTEVFAFRRCGVVKMVKGDQRVDVSCELEDDRVRAMVLMNVMFVGHVIAVMVVGFGLFAVASWSQGMRYGEERGPLLAQIESGDAQSGSSSVVEME